ncbi:hypothetical protein DL93DRAFT_2170181 [Clavulina sp. PMI_390]|nr:hypothetical protein DL93DRAFT_2170181 [Clavulina sp. PMI_390]
MLSPRKLTQWAATLGSLVAAQSCPDFTSYAQQGHAPYSNGTLKLPYQRPDPACRTFNSSAIEGVIANVTSRMKDPDLARLFENAFPNTLDTTVKYFDPSLNLAFIITGDITAQWLRDTGNQFAPYSSLLAKDPNLATLWRAVLNNEARYISQYPYCGSFQPPKESGLAPSVNDWATNVAVSPPVDNTTVFECKYEIDSLCGFLKLSRSYYDNTKDSSFANANWFEAITQIFRVINEQSQATFDANFNIVSYYNWTGLPGSLPGAVNNQGNGEPKGYTGMVGTHHRPSDDLSTFAFLVPANAMLSVELTNLASVLGSLKLTNATQVALAKSFKQSATTWSARIKSAIHQYGMAADGTYAYEVNGLGSQYLMDDANVPSLMSLPYLGFLDKSDAVYKSTKTKLLSRQNPYYAKGSNFFGIGGPHVSPVDPWPMALISAIYGSDDDTEITTYLSTILAHTDGLGLIHESVDVHNAGTYTRPWFAWANAYFAEMILDLAKRKPGLIFTHAVPYIVGS